MPQHPYKDLPDYCFWRQSVASPPPGQVDPVVRARFTIAPTDRVATAGSCFAQHIARHLKRNGFTFLVTESAHPLISPSLATEHNYGLFTARYGNLYTVRQLLQLLQRAYGQFQPAEDVWVQPDGTLLDPFRPQIQPGGFVSRAEYDADRAQHFAAVRAAVEQMDVFVFTLGLTECWRAREDGTVYPLCPGVSGGVFEPTRYEPHNFAVGEVAADLQAALAFMRERNLRLRVILTVSPVPLAATFEDRSVLVSTAYSKAVLLVACQQVAAALPDVAYFPSYEIITGAFNRGAYYADDLRNVVETGVGHVMRLFMQHYGQGAGALPVEPQQSEHVATKRMEEAVEVMCDEEMLARV